MRNEKETQPEKKKSSDTTSLLLTMADTTWRMLIPSAVFVLGLGVSVLLIKNQLKGVK